jgi:2-polyprenyl-3-methyl-5-hydroxy-6-metoxy-1,4-benzoquinol methylase
MILYDSCPCCGQKNIAFLFSAEDYTVSHKQFEIWQCENCKLRFTQNIPEVKEIGPYYQSANYVSHSDTKDGLVNKLYHSVRIRTLVQKRKLVEKATGKSYGNILDVGCGTGAFLNTMKGSGWNVTGLEPDDATRQKALELYKINVQPAQKLFSLPAESFDAITLWHVLEHVHELHAYVDKLKALLKRNGKLFIAVPNFTSYDAKVYKASWAAYDVPRHLYHFSPTAMKKLLSLHQMKLVSIKPMWYDSFYVSMLSEQYKTGKSHPLKAFINGAISNAKTILNTEDCSSLIYVATVKDN